LLASRLAELDPTETLEKYARMSGFAFDGVLPGCQAVKNTYSFYPVIFAEPHKAVAALWNRGFHALRGEQVHCLAKINDDDPHEDLTPEAANVLRSVVLLPITLETSEADVRELQQEVTEFTTALNRGLVLSMDRIISKI